MSLGKTLRQLLVRHLLNLHDELVIIEMIELSIKVEALESGNARTPGTYRVVDNQPNPRFSPFFFTPTEEERAIITTGQKIPAIKKVRERTFWGLLEAKRAVETVLGQ